MLKRLFATKSLDELCASATKEEGFKRSLTALDLTMLGIGAIIGTGIFVLTGQAAATNAGPSVILSFAIAGLASAFAALCYAEMASMIPVAGSAYTYAYATMGELLAWLIGWNLILEYLVGACTVSVGWSGYVVAFIHNITGKQLPAAWTSAPIAWNEITHQLDFTGAYINLPAIIISLVVTWLLIFGIQSSTRINLIIVSIKIAAILLFILFTFRFIKPANWVPFVPPNEGQFGKFGFSGIFQGATMVFFAYIGFDAVSTAAQESKNPQRNLPIGIICSLVVCTILYIAVCFALTGLVPYKQLSVPHPMAVAVAATGLSWLETVVEIGAIAGLSSVMLVFLLAQPRIFFSMANDGLFPKIASKLHPKYGTPYITTLITGGLVALGGGLLPIGILGELTSIGTLFAFMLVSVGVLILRIKRPDLPRQFVAPGGPYLVPILSALISLLLICTANFHTVIRLFLWMGIGLIIYAIYGYKNSRLRQTERILPNAAPDLGGISALKSSLTEITDELSKNKLLQKID